MGGGGGILKLKKQPKCETLRLGWHQNTGTLRGIGNARIPKLGGYPKCEALRLGLHIGG